MAACNLGYLYESGVGVEQDWGQAVQWYMRSAEQGYARGQYNLAWCYEHGKGVAKDRERAAELYEQAGEQQYKDARECAARLRRRRWHLGGGWGFKK